MSASPLKEIQSVLIVLSSQPTVASVFKLTLVQAAGTQAVMPEPQVKGGQRVQFKLGQFHLSSFPSFYS
jgi:hypothetical protein